MSFIDGVKKAFNFLKGDSIGAQLAKIAITGYALNRVTNSLNRDNAAPQQTTFDPNIRNQLLPDTNSKVPVVYGKSILGGNITDVHLSSNNTTLYVVYTLSEKTGNLISGTASSFTFRRMFYNGLELEFASDGTTVTKAIDRENNEITDINGLISVYCFNNGSTNPVAPAGYINSSLSNASNRMPNWTTAQAMNELVFAVVKFNYSADLTNSIGDFKFEIENTMTNPGDVLYDYMTNTRYGAGIPVGDINVS